MSGLEVAGLVLGAIPLVIEGLKQWRTTAEVLGSYRGIRKEHRKCLHDVEYYSILYARNVEALVRPILDDPENVDDMIDRPGSGIWSDPVLEDRLKKRLQESHDLYMVVITDMKGTIEELTEVLCLDNDRVQSRLREGGSPGPSSLISARSKLEFEKFRVKFTLGEAERKKILVRLEESNERLTKLLSTSDQMSALRSPPPTSTAAKASSTSTLESIFNQAKKQSDILFKALYKSWQCRCQQSHSANLRLEHRTASNICFDLILMFASSVVHATQPDCHWTWREIQCGQMDCSVSKQLLCPQKTSAKAYAVRTKAVPSTKGKKVSFGTADLAIPMIELNMPVDTNMKLCERLGDGECGECMGIIGHESQTYHLHPFTKRKQLKPGGPWTLDHVLSAGFERRPPRRQRYELALLLASSFGQLQFTDWLRTDLSKGDVLFFPCGEDECGVSFHEAFIRQGFPSQDASRAGTEAGKNYTFPSLGILLLELCFGKRIEDHPLRQKYPQLPGELSRELSRTFDVMAGLEWCQQVRDEAGDDYAAAVKWCFTGTEVGNRTWRKEFIESVIRPLEMCQQHFKTTAR